MNSSSGEEVLPAVYGNGRWNAGMRFMIDAISQSEARRRYEEKGAPFSVAVGEGLVNSGEEALRAKAAGIELPVPEFTLSFFGGEAGLRLSLFDAHGSATVLADFEKLEPHRLFLTSLANYEYLDQDQYFPLHEAVTVTEHKFTPDGYSQQTTQLEDEEEVEVIQRREVPVDWLWVPMPPFGQWASIGRLLTDPENMDPASNASDY